MAINGWNTPDGGNSCAIYPAGTFSPKKALAQFPAIEATGLTLSQSALTLEESSSATLTATVLPDYATDKKVTWSTSDADVAIVVKGVVVGLGIGTATITAKVGDQVATCEVTVVKKTIAVRSIILDQTAATVIEGDTLTLTATVNPDNADDKTVTWKSSDTSVAIVDNGVVITLAPGKATISATAGGKTATCVVTVEERYIPVSEVILNYTEITLEVGESINIEATVLPENATEPTISWKSSSSKIATIRRKVISAVAPGTATITAKAGDIEAYCVVTVKSADSIDAATAEERYTIYDITGRLVRQDALSTDGLKQGIYIINGRKTVIE
jgi:uncharacterized protein YjdB